MQQFYTEIRGFNVRRDDGIEHGEVSNSKNWVDSMMKPGEKPGEDMNPDSQKSWQQEYEDYQKFVEKFGGKDEVYCPFDLEIQTNSTLPMDRQALANLMMRLLELGAVDAQALLETLRVPKAEEITQRLKQQQQPQTQGQPKQTPAMPVMPG